MFSWLKRYSLWRWRTKLMHYDRRRLRHHRVMEEARQLTALTAHSESETWSRARKRHDREHRWWSYYTSQRVIAARAVERLERELKIA